MREAGCGWLYVKKVALKSKKTTSLTRPCMGVRLGTRFNFSILYKTNIWMKLSGKQRAEMFFYKPGNLAGRVGLSRSKQCGGGGGASAGIGQIGDGRQGGTGGTGDVVSWGDSGSGGSACQGRVAWVQAQRLGRGQP